MTEKEPRTIKKSTFVELCLNRIRGLSLEDAAAKLNRIAKKEGFDIQFNAKNLESHLDRIGGAYVWRARGIIHVNAVAWNAVLEIEKNTRKYAFIAEDTSIDVSVTTLSRRRSNDVELRSSEITAIKDVVLARSKRD